MADQLDPEAEQKLIRQIDVLQELSKKHRDAALGVNWKKSAADFYMMMDGFASSVIPFRPKISIPALQMLVLNEAADLSDQMPKIFLVNGEKRDEPLEKALQAEWQNQSWNLDTLNATIYSLYHGVSAIEPGYDDLYNDGQGRATVTVRDAYSFFPDPYAKDDEDLGYVIFIDRMTYEEIAKRWPDKAEQIGTKKVPQGSPARGFGGLRMLPGPMSNTQGKDGEPDPDDGRMEVRRTFVRDYTVVDFPEDAADVPGVVKPKKVMKYPNGRYIVDCIDTVLLDSENPYDFFPLVRFHAMPPLFGPWAPPPIRFTMDLQQLAQKMYTQVYENCVRLNNGVVFIPENTGINPEAYGGLPAEVHMIAAGSNAPEVKWPNPMPQHMVELPKLLLDMQRQLQGFTEARTGQAPAGNVSAPLYESAVSQAQGLTKLRAKMIAVSIQRMANLLFQIMAKFYRQSRYFASVSSAGLEVTEWKGPVDAKKYVLKVDPNSVRPMATAGMKALVPVLRQQGLIDVRAALEWLDVPGAAEIAERVEKEQKLAALAAAQQQQKK